ncbi:MAG: TIM barrel protein [Ferruginibacter sp.]
MLLGIGSYSFPWAVSIYDAARGNKLTAKDLIDYASLNKIGSVQYGDNLPLHKLNHGELNELKVCAARSEVQIEVGTRGLNIENIEQYIRIAKTLGSKFVRMVIDDVGFHPEVPEVIEITRSVLPLLAKEQVMLAIENHDRFPAMALKNIIQSTDPELIGVCLDTANSIGAGEGIREVVDILAPFTVNLHIKDFIVKRVDHKMGFIVEGTAAGDGMLDIPWLIRELGNTGKCKTATLELWINPGLEPEQTLLKEKHWVDKSIEYLKNIIK